MDILTGILIPFIWTTAGSSCVFFLRGELKPGVQKAFLGFASGVMVAASVWSLLIPAMEMSDGLGRLAFLPAVTGFLLGMAFLLFLDMVVPHLHMDTDQPEGAKSNWKKSTMLVLAVTLHNIPEGMAVGVAFAGMLAKSECNTEFPGRSSYLSSFKRSGRAEKSLCLRYAFRYCRAHRRRSYAVIGRKTGALYAIFPFLCSRCHALRSSGRTGAGSIRRGTFQYWYHRICHWVCIDDGP